MNYQRSKKHQISDRFAEIGIIDKLFFTFFILTISSSVISLIYLILPVFHDRYIYFSKFWILLNAAVILIFLIVALKKLKLNSGAIGALGFFLMLAHIIFNHAIPSTVQNNFIGLRATDESGYVIDDAYCIKGDPAVDSLIREGYYIEREYYSWKEARLLKRGYCGNNLKFFNSPFDAGILTGFCYFLERTFTFLPYTFAFALIITLIGFFRRKDLGSFTHEFITEIDFDINRINVFGLMFIGLIVLYNILYMNSF